MSAARCARALALAALLALASACAKPYYADVEPGQRPPLGSVEAGLWMQMDRVEQQLKSSGHIVRDPGLDKYLRALVCTLSQKYCDSIRIYVVQTPEFNASMSPNGVMEVWSGMLMRVENEAQLAYVLAHEISHFERRHSLQQWRDTKIKSDGLIFVELLSAAAGAGYVGNLARLIAVSSMFAFSRNQEEEADLRGFELARQAGYDVREASEVWRNLLEEEALEKQRSRQLIFFSSHPATAARLETLRGLAEGTTSDFDGRERLREILLPVRAEFIREELRSGRFERTQWLLSRMVESGSALGEIEFYRGELHRYRAEPGDEDKALDFYRSATEQEGAPPEAFRQIGLIHRRRGETKQAGLAFESYLQLAPNASDHKMIESYLAPRETQP